MLNSVLIRELDRKINRWIDRCLPVYGYKVVQGAFGI